MIRFISELGLFLLPFGLFLVFLIATRREAFAPEHWRGARGWLAVAGVGLAVAGIIAETLRLDGQTGIYRPAHLENGRLVPGRFEAPAVKP